jgi:putative redox protein
MESLKITFPGAGGEALAARLEMPAGRPTAYALFAHCFTCGKDSRAAVQITRALAARGIATLRFDFTGLGGSGGDFANTHFSANVADLVAAADWLRREHRAPALLIGHSLGGAAILAAAGRVAECKAVATIAAPADADHVLHNFHAALPEIEAKGEAAVTLGGRSFTIRRAFLEDVKAQAQQDHIARLRRALLVLHAPADAVVGIDNATRIFTTAKHPKSFVSLDDADHLLSRPADGEYAAGVIAAWAQRYLPVAAPAAAEPAGHADRVVVEETGAGKLQVRVQVGPHGFLADEPAALGGLGSGPNPYDLLCAALGACKSMTMRLYAERKGWPLTRAHVAVRHGRVHAADCADCETREGRVDEFTCEIALEGPLDDEQRARIFEIAERCPVHRTLTGEIKIRASLAPPE